METTSAIVCDPAIAVAEDRTMFYLKAGFHMIADDRRPFCDLRCAIIWKPALRINPPRTKTNPFLQQYTLSTETPSRQLLA